MSRLHCQVDLFIVLQNIGLVFKVTLIDQFMMSKLLHKNNVLRYVEFYVVLMDTKFSESKLFREDERFP